MHALHSILLTSLIPLLHHQVIATRDLPPVRTTRHPPEPAPSYNRADSATLPPAASVLGRTYHAPPVHYDLRAALNHARVSKSQSAEPRPTKWRMLPPVRSGFVPPYQHPPSAPLHLQSGPAHTLPMRPGTTGRTVVQPLPSPATQSPTIPRRPESERPAQPSRPINPSLVDAAHHVREQSLHRLATTARPTFPQPGNSGGTRHVPEEQPRASASPDPVSFPSARLPLLPAKRPSSGEVSSGAKARTDAHGTAGS